MAETNQWRWFDSASRARPRLHSSCDSLRPPASAGEKRRWKRGRADGFLKRFENRIKNTSADVTSRSFQLCANLSRHPSLCHGCMTNQLSFVGEEAGGTMGAKSVEVLCVCVYARVSVCFFVILLHCCTVKVRQAPVGRRKR